MIKIDHLGVAVRNLDEAIKTYETLGFSVGEICEIPTERVRAAFLPLGEARIELLEPTSSDSPISRFLERRSGLHHLCILVDDLDLSLANLKAKGVALLDETPRVGANGSRVAFLHPKAGGGVLLELKERPRGETR